MSTTKNKRTGEARADSLQGRVKHIEFAGLKLQSVRTLNILWRRLTPKEQKQAADFARNHKNVRMYRSRNKSITLSRDAMHSSCRETFWLRFPDTAEDRRERRRGFLVPRQRPNDSR